MSDPSADDLDAVSALARLIGERLTPLYHLAPSVMPGILPIDLAGNVYEHLRSGDADAARMLLEFLWPAENPPEDWWDTVIGRRCIQLGVEEHPSSARANKAAGSTRLTG